MTTLFGDIILNSKKYRVARKESGLAYETSTRNTQSGQGDWEIVIDDWSGGMGLARLPAGQQYTRRYYYSKDMDATTPGYLRPRQVEGTIIPAVDRAWLEHGFEERIGTTDYVYLLFKDGGSPTNAISVKVSLGTTPAVVDEESSGNSLDEVGQPVKAFRSSSSGERWYIPLGNGSRIWVLHTLVEGGADTYAVFTTVTDGATHFQIVGDTIWRSHSTNQIDSFAIGPTTDFETDANWAGINQSVGQSDLNITGLTALGRLLFIGTEAGMFGGDADGNLLDMLPELAPAPNANLDQGTNLRAWHGKLFFPASNQGLSRHDLVGAFPVGPDAMPENTGDVPNLTFEPRFGWHGGVVPTPKWLYALYPIDSTRMYILVAREREPGDESPHELIWHPLVLFGGTITDEKQAGLVISWTGNNPRLWFKDPSVLNISYFFDLADDGSPYRPNSDRGTSGTRQMFQAEHDMGTPGTLKYLREAELIVENGTANASWTMHYYADGGTEKDIGAAITASGATTRFVTAGTDDTFRAIRPSIKCTINGALADERASVRRMVLRGGFLPDVSNFITYILDVSEGWYDAQGVIHPDPPTQTVDTLEALRYGAVRTLIDHTETSVSVIVESVDAVDPQKVGLDTSRTYVSVTMKQVDYS